MTFEAHPLDVTRLYFSRTGYETLRAYARLASPTRQHARPRGAVALESRSVPMMTKRSHCFVAPARQAAGPFVDSTLIRVCACRCKYGHPLGTQRVGRHHSYCTPPKGR